MKSEYPELQTNDTLRYLQGLFNTRKYIHEHKMGNEESQIPFYQTYNELQGKVDSILDRSKYNKVDLRNIFTFMNKNWYLLLIVVL